jgi:cobalt-zinc-cadmium efflux system outer membrane protein
VYSDVDQAWIGYVSAKKLSDRYSSHYIDESKEVLDIAQFAYEHGGISLIDYLDSLRDYRSTNLANLNAFAQTWMAIHQLSYATATEIVP